MLRDRNIDLALGRVTLPMPEGDLAVTALLDERPVIVGGAESQWAKRRRVQLKELIGEAWVLYDPDSAAATMHAKIFRQSGLELPRASVTCGSVHLAASLAATGRFLTVVPASALRLGAGRLGVKALPIDLPAAPRSLAIVTLKGKRSAPSLSSLFVVRARSWGSRSISKTAESERNHKRHPFPRRNSSPTSSGYGNSRDIAIGHADVRSGGECVAELAGLRPPAGCD